jgi:ABC-type transport system involved in multi-copper enzyme maturation permease subunit
MSGVLKSMLFFFDHARRSKSFWILLGSSLFLIAIAGGISSITLNNMGVKSSGIKIAQFYDFLLSALLNGTTQLVILVGLFTVSFTVNSVVKKGVLDIFLSFPIRRWEILTGAFLFGIVFMAVILLITIFGVWLVHSMIFGIYNAETLHFGLLSLLGFAVMLHFVLIFSFGFRSPIAGLLIAICYSLLISPIITAINQVSKDLQSVVAKEIISAIYWILPKSADLSGPFMKVGQSLSGDNLWYIISSTILFVFAVFGLTITIFEKKDY